MEEVKTYCFLHVYYEELVEETMSYVNNIPLLNKIFINIPDVKEASHNVATRQHVEKLIPQGVDYEFYNFKNTGRDVGAFFRLTKETKDLVNPEDIVYCIHTKACQLHQIGDVWRKELLGPLLGNPSAAESIHALFRNNEIDYAASARKSMTWYGVNESNYHELCDRLKINIKYRLGDFTAGTIFVLRYKYLEKLFSKIYEFDYTEEDNHQADGLKTHATERMFTTVVRSMEGKIKYV